MSVGAYCCFLFFFFQAEDGIRDLYVTGVQTCALPICRPHLLPGRVVPLLQPDAAHVWVARRRLLAARCQARGRLAPRSEERRVGKSVDLGGRRIIKKKKKWM